MNDTTNTTAAPDETVIEGAIVEVKPDNSLVVLDPTRYATELFAPFAAELATAKRSAARKPYDVNTDAGMVVAKELRTTFVKIRTRADKAKSEAKKPIDQAGKKILEIYNAIEAAAKAEEKKHNDVIVAREAEIAAEAQRKLDAERARIEAIESRVASIRSFPDTLAKADSVAIDKALAALAEKQLLPADYQEYLEDALTAFNATVDRLREMLTQAQEREAAQRKAEEDARELARLKAEAAEREKRETEERQQREADEKAKADAAAKFAADQAQMIADLQAKLAAATAPATAPAPEPEPAPMAIGDTGVDVRNVVFNTGASGNGIVTAHGPSGHFDTPGTGSGGSGSCISGAGGKYSGVGGTGSGNSGYSGGGGNDDSGINSIPAESYNKAGGAGGGNTMSRARPIDSSIITSVAIYFNVSAETAIEWMAEIDYAAAREAVKVM